MGPIFNKFIFKKVGSISYENNSSCKFFFGKSFLNLMKGDVENRTSENSSVPVVYKSNEEPENIVIVYNCNNNNTKTINRISQKISDTYPTKINNVNSEKFTLNDPRE